MTRTTLAIALVAIATAAAAQQPQPAQPYDRPPEFSCSGQPLDFTREELERKALAEVARRGGKLPARYTTMLKRWGCDWWVFLLLAVALLTAAMPVSVSSATASSSGSTATDRVITLVICGV